MRRTQASLLPLVEAARGAEAAADEENDQLVRRTFDVTVRALNQEERSVEVVVSSESLDAHGDVVDQDWDLKRYKRNPVVLWSHNNSFFSGPEADLPIGYAKDVAVRNGRLEATLVFVDEKANPMAEKVWQGFRQKSLHAVSAGFRPHSVSREVEDDFEYFRLSKNELYEISVCPIGSNPDAVAKEKALTQLKALAAKSTRSAAPEINAPIGAQKEPAMETKELEDKIKTLEAAAAKNAESLSTTTKALETANASVADLTSKLAASEKAFADTSAKLEAETKLRGEAEKTVTTLKVDALVGKKITPAERDEYVELALERPALFEKMMAKRADLPAAVGKVVVEAEKGIPAPIAADGGNGDALAALIEKATNFAPLESFGAVGEDTVEDA